MTIETARPQNKNLQGGIYHEKYLYLHFCRCCDACDDGGVRLSADGRRCTCSCGRRLGYPDFRCDRYLGHCQSTAGRAGQRGAPYIRSCAQSRLMDLLLLQSSYAWLFLPLSIRKRRTKVRLFLMTGKNQRDFLLFWRFPVSRYGFCTAWQSAYHPAGLRRS